MNNNNKLQEAIKRTYGSIAKKPLKFGANLRNFTKSLDYTSDQTNNIPLEANLGLGCGNPTAITSLKAGETVLDLGSGAGFDCFIAARKVGITGKVIGIDMTSEMINKARENAINGNFANVQFILGTIEKLPIEDSTIDVVISNCVINLSSNKQKVFQEIYRVLKPGGRVAISDMAWAKSPPRLIRKSLENIVGCIGGALEINKYESIIRKVGFGNIKLTPKGYTSCNECALSAASNISGISSINIEATKPLV